MAINLFLPIIISNNTSRILRRMRQGSHRGSSAQSEARRDLVSRRTRLLLLSRWSENVTRTYYARNASFPARKALRLPRVLTDARCTIGCHTAPCGGSEAPSRPHKPFLFQIIAPIPTIITRPSALASLTQTSLVSAKCRRRTLR